MTETKARAKKATAKKPVKKRRRTAAVRCLIENEAYLVDQMPGRQEGCKWEGRVAIENGRLVNERCPKCGCILAITEIKGTPGLTDRHGLY